MSRRGAARDNWLGRITTSTSIAFSVMSYGWTHRCGDDVEIAGTLAKGFPHQHQAVRMGKWQRLQQRVVDHAKDGGVGANAQGQGQHGDNREARVSGEVAKAVTDVLKKSCHQHLSSQATASFGRGSVSCCQVQSSCQG